MHDACVIFNPAAGKRRARRRLQELQKTQAGHVDFLPTDRPGHGVELARQAALDGYPLVIAAGGDGTVHEVANGLLQAGRPQVRFGIFPIGSANDYAHSVGLDDSGASTRTVDVGIVQASGREKYFLCNLGLGFNGAVTLESRQINHLQGVALYGLATLRALWKHYRCPRLEIGFDDEPARPMSTLMLTVLIGRREGGFVLAPDAKIDDGLFDYVHVGPLTRWQVARYLPRLALWGPSKDDPLLQQGQCRRVRVTSPDALIVHVDGEFFARPEDDVREVDIRILPRALTVAQFPDEPEA